MCPALNSSEKSGIISAQLVVGIDVVVVLVF